LPAVTEKAPCFVFLAMLAILCMLRLSPACRRPPAPVRLLFVLIALAGVGHSAEGGKRSYELPPGDAAITLRQVSAISGREILFAAEAVRGVRTNSVHGDFTPIEAVARLLTGTVLSVVQDEKTGALAVRREKHLRENPPLPSANK
jgi:hypothetical protein